MNRLGSNDPMAYCGELIWSNTLLTEFRFNEVEYGTERCVWKRCNICCVSVLSNQGMFSVLCFLFWKSVFKYWTFLIWKRCNICCISVLSNQGMFSVLCFLFWKSVFKYWTFLIKKRCNICYISVFSNQGMFSVLCFLFWKSVFKQIS